MPRADSSDDEAHRELVTQLHCQSLTKAFQDRLGLLTWHRHLAASKPPHSRPLRSYTPNSTRAGSGNVKLIAAGNVSQTALILSPSKLLMRPWLFMG